MALAPHLRYDCRRSDCLAFFRLVDMKRFIAAAILVLGFTGGTLAAQDQTLRKTTSVEGVTEYRLPHGLRVLPLPDPGVETITVHITSLVGSRHEGYGEKGMAHLLEHMLFKGAKRYPDVKEQFTRRGARWNGTTASD